MDSTSSATKAISDAIGLLHQGETQRAREALLQMWDRLSPDGEPLQICTLAHFLADTETEVAAELEWDLRALEAAIGTRGTEDRDALSPELANFLPSLHLNVGDGYRRLRDNERAREHALNGLNRAGVLADDGYGNMIKGGLRRLREHVGAASDAPSR
jgi:hypothetical protein